MLMNGTRLTIAVVAAAVLGIGVVLGYRYWPGGEDISEAPPAEEREKAAKYIASDRFAKLDDETKRTYVEKFVGRPGGGPPRGFRATTQLSDGERKRFIEQFRPVMRKMMAKRIDDYFALPPAEQTKRLDEIIDSMEARRLERERRAATRPSGGEGSDRREGRRRRGFTPERLKHILENTEPEMRAKFVEFRKAIEKRRAERGLPPRRGPPR